MNYYLTFKKVFLFVALSSVGGYFVPTSFAAPLYRETFGICDPNDIIGKQAQELSGWQAFKSNSAVGKLGFLKLQLPGSPDSLASTNSFPQGSLQAGAIWSRPAVGVTIFTEEFNFDLRDLYSVIYQQRLTGADATSGENDGSKLILLVGDTWYISDEIQRQVDRGVWEDVRWSVRDITFGTTKNKPGKGPRPANNSGVKLPESGVVFAFGAFIPVANDRARIDNYTLANLRPEAPSYEDPSSPVCYRPQSPETPPLVPVNPPSTVDSIPTANEPSSPAVPQAIFCRGRSARALGKVKIVHGTYNKFIETIPTSSLSGLRDRAVLSLLLNNDLRVDNLVNLLVSDFYTVGSLPVLSTSGVTRQTKALKNSVKGLLEEYLEKAKISPNMPLFQKFKKSPSRLRGAALCTNQIAQIVRRREAATNGRFKIRIRS